MGVYIDESREDSLPCSINDAPGSGDAHPADEGNPVTEYSDITDEGSLSRPIIYQTIPDQNIIHALPPCRMLQQCVLSVQ